jgi:type I restriction enzyme S subunit
LKKNEVLDCPIFYPPNLIEQYKIANFLTSIDEKIEKLGQQIDDAQIFKKGLLQQMFV